MKMVKTFIKTQHQHVMPPEKGKKESQRKMYKANERALSPAKATGGPSSRPRLGTQRRGSGVRTALVQSTTQPIAVLCFSVVSLKI